VDKKETQGVSLRIPVELHAQLKYNASFLPKTSVHSLLIRGAELALEEAIERKRQLHLELLEKEVIRFAELLAYKAEKESNEPRPERPDQICG